MLIIIFNIKINNKYIVKDVLALHVFYLLKLIFISSKKLYINETFKITPKNIFSNIMIIDKFLISL